MNKNHEFIDKSVKVHGEHYDYSKSVYVNENEPVIIICPIHGEFKQKAYVHVRGSGCPKCSIKRMSDSKRMPCSKYEEKINAVNPCSLRVIGEYSGMGLHKKVKIECLDHSVCFEYGAGKLACGDNVYGRCPGLQRERWAEKSFAHFVKEATIIHGDRFDYIKLEHKNHVSFLHYICKTHGYKIQGSSYHLQGNGCPDCSWESMPGQYNPLKMNEDLFRNKLGWLYLSRLHDPNTGEQFYKIGVTSQDPETRMRSIPYESEILLSAFCNMYDIVNVEQTMLSKLDRYQPNIKFKGHTECFYDLDCVEFLNLLQGTIDDQEKK